MRSVEEHQRVVAGLITVRPATAAELSDAEGQVLAADVTATVPLPVFDNSTMDGYALRAAMRLADPYRPRRSAVLTETLTSAAGKRQFRRGVFDAAAGTVVSHGPPGSHHLGWLASANCLLDIPAEVTAISAGSAVQVWDLGSSCQNVIRG